MGAMGICAERPAMCAEPRFRISEPRTLAPPSSGPSQSASAGASADGLPAAGSPEGDPGGPLAFLAAAHREAHLERIAAGEGGGGAHAGAALASPLLLGVCGGAGAAGRSGEALLLSCQRQAEAQLAAAAGAARPAPGAAEAPRSEYRGPVALLQEALAATSVLGSSTVMLATLDNESRIHGKPRPMIAVLSIGDCGMLLLRRPAGEDSDLEVAFSTEDISTPAPAPAGPNVGAGIDLAGSLPPGALAPATTEAGAWKPRDVEALSDVRCLSITEGDVVLLASNAILGAVPPSELAARIDASLRGPRAGRALLPPRAPPSGFHGENAGDGALAERRARLLEAATDVTLAAHARPLRRHIAHLDDHCVVVAEVVRQSTVTTLKLGANSANLANAGG
eukprot:TRINITY_DN40649_c0_g1_i1.p1 TRINITY_DN40649_c0_g1~~TRINITY_DN40649_c0_g1_i1.p1  ORF type:complete len:419 (+),score=70.12 TRINITY_DN40649_c0_g1_i1:74-1258(+)